MYKHPGVYVEHVPSGLLSIEAASTSIAAFIGAVGRGELVTNDKEDGKPVYISSAAQYSAQFGELDGAAGGIRNKGADPDDFGHAVQAFFANGGTKAYIVPIGDGNGESATTVIGDPEDATKAFGFTAMSAGKWANSMVVRMKEAMPAAAPNPAIYEVEIGVLDGNGKFDPLVESHTDLTLDPASGQYLEEAVNAASSLVKVKHDVRANFLGAVDGVESGDLSGLDPTTIAAGQKLELTFTGDAVTGQPIEVTFSGAATSLADLAAEIQADARGASGANARKNFVATATGVGTLRLLPGASDTAGVLNTVTVSGGTAQAALALNPGTTISESPVLPWGGKKTDGTLSGGTEHGAPGTSDYSDALIHLRDYRDVSIIMLPGKHWLSGGDNGAIEAAITHAEFMQNCMVLVDPANPVGNTRLQSPVDVRDAGYPTSPYTALYYPWMEVANPYYDTDTAANLPRTFKVPPGPFAAGMWARIGGRRGVWKAPAGLEATVRGAIGPTIDIGNDLQDNLNEYGVNCLRAIIGPTVIWGARTRATKTKPEYRYIPVRRTQSMIGESLYRALQAVVFEPNDHRLWGSLRANVGAFMDTLHRAGAFQGEKASDAYYVKCNLGETMTQADIDAGVVRVVVGFAPLKPAEFVVVHIKQIVGLTA